MIKDDPNAIKDLPRYMNNARLKAAGVNMSLTGEQLVELEKCIDDPIYFIETYIKIISIDNGLVPFKLWDFQKELIKHTLGNRFTIARTGRQQGKCVSGDSTVRIRRRSGNKEIVELSIEDFYTWQSFCDTIRKNYKNKGSDGTTTIKEMSDLRDKLSP